MKVHFVTEYGAHLGKPEFFFVTVKSESSIDYEVIAEPISARQARYQILDRDVKFLHSSLLTDMERTAIFHSSLLTDIRAMMVREVDE